MKSDSAIKHFLFIYDRKRDRSISIDDYGENVDGAVDAYRAAEIIHADHPWIDIVLIGSDSLETIKKTHSTYFEGQSRKSIAQSIMQAM